MKKRTFLLVAICLFTHVVLSQNINVLTSGNGNYWGIPAVPTQIYAENNGVGNLSTGGPAGYEAIAHANHPDGSIAFYVSGGTVYDANHQQMPNGTALLASTTNSEIEIGRKPGTQNQY